MTLDQGWIVLDCESELENIDFIPDILHFWDLD